jgi:hypothetical protein
MGLAASEWLKMPQGGLIETAWRRCRYARRISRAVIRASRTWSF